MRSNCECVMCYMPELAVIFFIGPMGLYIIPSPHNPEFKHSGESGFLKT